MAKITITFSPDDFYILNEVFAYYQQQLLDDLDRCDHPHLTKDIQTTLDKLEEFFTKITELFDALGKLP
jgi:hypothetical protein